GVCCRGREGDIDLAEELLPSAPERVRARGTGAHGYRGGRRIVELRVEDQEIVAWGVRGSVPHDQRRRAGELIIVDIHEVAVQRALPETGRGQRRELLFGEDTPQLQARA